MNRLRKKLVHIWNCITHWKKWRHAKAIDGAIVVLWNNGYNRDVAIELMNISNEIWEDIHA